MSVRLYPQLFVEGRMSYLRYVCLFTYSGVQHILYCVFLRLVYSMLALSLDCPFLITPSVFTDVCLIIFIVFNISFRNTYPVITEMVYLILQWLNF